MVLAHLIRRMFLSVKRSLSQSKRWTGRCCQVFVALKGSSIPFTAYQYDSSKAFSLSSSVVLLKTQRLKLWYHQKRSRTGIFWFFFVVLLLLINGCYILFYMVVHDALRSLVLGFRGTWFFCLFFKFPSPSIVSVFIQVRFLSGGL